MELEANNKRELENELYSKEFREKEGKEETQMTTKAKKGQLHLYCAYLTSMWFESIDDLINFELCSPRFNGNMTKFHFNPFPLNEITREFFPYLQTVFIYDRLRDNQFEQDEIKWL